MTTLFGSLALIVILAGMLWFVRKAGKDAVKADLGKANADAAKRIAESQANAPRDKRDVVVRLRSSERKL